jgi:predicted nucleic acid-binding protein
VATTYLLDTNLLVYCFDEGASQKKERALRTIERTGRAPSAALPAQVLAEFANVALYKLKPPLAPADVYEQVERYEAVFPILPLMSAITLEAVRGVRDHHFSYFDAQIWAAAKLNQIPTVLSEGFSTGATVEGVTFLNPLANDFDLTDL